MNKAETMAACLTSAGVVVAFVVMMAAWVRLVRAKGFAEALRWMVVLPAPMSKAMYIFMLFLVSRHADPPVNEQWLVGAACVFAFVALAQAFLYSRRLAKERLLTPDDSAELRDGITAFVVKARLAPEYMFRQMLHFMVLGIIETLAIAAFVLTLTIGRYGMNTGNVAAREAERVVGGLSASFVSGAVEGAKEAITSGDKESAK